MTSIKADGRIEFRFYRPGAKEVKVVGTFNKWSAHATPMRPMPGGWWTLDAMLEPGEHRFRYVADGHWYTDFAANGVERNKYGWNSILIVPERRLRIVAGRDQAVGQTQTPAEAVAA